MEPITNVLVRRIEQLAWKAAGGLGKVDALPEGGEWMEATAEAVGVPVCVVTAIIGDMREHTIRKWQHAQRSTKIGADGFHVDPSKTPAPSGQRVVLNKGEVFLDKPIRCKCRARITVLPCRTCGHGVI